ncbi:MAG: hypothetical protein A2X49_02795 [Lentisphaerae bacterium GWF2_52_8]|nr:MAG: hypothetical protein A2X49_02795 [Lentisphaerae bacterium GWF2_52_8]
MKKKISLALAVAGIFFLMGSIFAEEAAKQKTQEKKVQTECPVMGKKINKSLFVDYDGKRIYVCCSGCIGTVKADPGKYIKEIEAKGIVLEATPKDSKVPAESKETAPKTEKKEGEHSGHQH